MIQALEKINLRFNNIDDDGARCLALALQKNTVVFIHVRCSISYVKCIDCYNAEP